MDLISVIVPVYNAEKYIERCLNSIVNQTYKKLEIIIIDDGSTDNSYDICVAFKKKYHNINLIHKYNEGLGLTRNLGINVCNGRYVTFIDADDFIDIDHIENMYNFLIKTGSDTCLCGYQKYFNNCRIIQHYNVEREHTYTGDNIAHNILSKMCGKLSDDSDYIEMSVCMSLFSVDIIKNNNLSFCSERTYISEDLIFDFDYYTKCKKVCICDDIGYYYCDNNNSLTTKYRSDRFTEQVKLTKKIKELAKEYNILSVVEERINNTLVAIARYSIKLEVKFMKTNGNNVAINNIKAICNDRYLMKVFNEYNHKRVKITSRIVNYLIIKKRIIALIIIMKLKNAFNI